MDAHRLTRASFAGFGAVSRRRCISCLENKLRTASKSQARYKSAIWVEERKPKFIIRNLLCPSMLVYNNATLKKMKEKI